MVKSLGLGYEKIDVCPKGCMLYYGPDELADTCKFCNETRYKTVDSTKRSSKPRPKKTMRYFPLTGRLQRLYMSTATAKHMTWHRDVPRSDGVLSHPADGEAWKDLDEKYPLFAAEPRNVRLGLSSDGFSPFGQMARSYSCWSVIVTPYNLPSWMCMKTPYMFLTLIIPGPTSPKKNIDIYLQPLIDELKTLWEDGANTYDAYMKQNFQMKAALLWTINDFSAYGILSGWSTHGRLGCPICMEYTKAF
nr:hypothetical protein [Serratia marcescens]